MLITKQTNQPETETQTNQQDTLRETFEGKYIQGVSKRSSGLCFIHFTTHGATSNKVEGIFKLPIPYTVEKYTKSSCLSRNWPRYLQNSADKIKMKMSKKFTKYASLFSPDILKTLIFFLS